MQKLKDNERAKEFLQCLGNGKTIYQCEAENEVIDDCIIFCGRCGKETEWDDYGLCRECWEKEGVRFHEEKV